MQPPVIVGPISATAGIRWPGLPHGRGTALLALLYQIQQSQWWPAAELRRQQLRQLHALLSHCRDAVPYYRAALDAAGFDPGTPLTEAVWARLPLLTREDIQNNGKALAAATIPKGHGKTASSTSSGSTGKPVTVRSTELSQLYWQAQTVLDHLWHRRDVTKTLAAIRSMADDKGRYPDGGRAKSWGPSTGAIFTTGPSVLLNVLTSIEDQAEWLQRQDPEYLISLPTNVLQLAEYCREHGVKLAKLRQVETLGGIVKPAVRAACREVWGVPLVDTYSANEIGYLALQCPDHDHYHVMAQGAAVEVIGDNGRPCGPGETGLVVVTPLHNYAMPLLRYEIGDYAELGPPCPCGRTLPVLARIHGRVRNMMTLPDGSKVSPTFVNDWFEGLPVAQFQILQHDTAHLEAKIVAKRPFEDGEAERAVAAIRSRLPADFRVTLSFHDEIPRGPGGKYEDFKSAV